LARYFRNTCGECDEPVVYDSKNHRYVHANRGVKYLHDVSEVLSEELTEGR